MTIDKINEWWMKTDFKEMEEITNFKQLEFNPEEGYQDFVDVCNNWWKNLSDESKKDYYNEYN